MPRSFSYAIDAKRIQSLSPYIRQVRFWNKIDQSGDCWIWRGYVGTHGYGTIDFRKEDGTRIRSNSHRFSYETLVGPIPDGLTIDHLCRVRTCVNPKHLEAVTQKVNNLRGTSPQAVNAHKTHCKWGHPFSEKNTLLYWYQVTQTYGYMMRQCRICIKRRSMEQTARRKSIATSDAGCAACARRGKA